MMIQIDVPVNASARHRAPRQTETYIQFIRVCSTARQLDIRATCVRMLDLMSAFQGTSK